MKRLMLAAALLVSVTAPAAHADLKLTQNVSGRGMGMSGNTVTTTYIKGLKMRTDSVSGDTTRTTIFDVDAQKMYVFDSKKKEAETWEMADFGKQVGMAVDTSVVASSVKPNGQTRQLSGNTATGYDMSISMPARMGDEKSGMKMTVTLSGPVWIVKGAPGTEDYLRFYKAAADKGWIFGDPRAANGAPGQAKAMTEMYRQLAATGGVPYETEMNIKMSGEGPMAAMMAKMGGIATTTTVQSSESAALPDALFMPPADYKLTPRK
jgi:hypothetical protein